MTTLNREDIIRMAREAGMNVVDDQYSLLPFLEKFAALVAAAAKAEEREACVTYKEVADTMNALWAGTLEQVQIAEEMKDRKLYTSTPIEATPLASQSQSDVKPWGGLTNEVLQKHWPKVWPAQGSFVRASADDLREFAHGIKGDA